MATHQTEPTNALTDFATALADVSEERLDNGLRLVLAPDSSVPAVAVNLWYAVGSRDEPPGQTGFAHLFEHMMFQGSAHVPKNGHFEHVERAGGTANATTWFDRTNYFETLPSNHLDLALWLESDRMGWMLPALTEEKLENQRSVVLNERRERYENQPYGDWDERLQRLLFPPGHPYHHTVIGAVEDIEAATMEDVRAFSRAHYVPDNAVLTLCGDFDRDTAGERVRRWFDAIPPGKKDERPRSAGARNSSGATHSQGAEAAALDATGPIESAGGGAKREEVSARVPLPRVYMASRVPPFTTEDFYAGQVVSACLGAGRGSRLHERLVRGARIAESVSCHLLPLVGGATMFLVVATGLPGTEIDELEKAAAREMEAAASLAAEEAARAVALLETRTLRALQGLGTRADTLSMYATFFGSAARAQDDLTRLRRVATTEAEAWAETYLHGSNRAVVRYVPAEDG